jgi:Ca2+-transporting ATPase
MDTANQSTTSRPWHALDAAEVARVLNADTAEGLAGADARQRLDQYGPNSLPKAPTPSAWSIALAILKDPMNLLLAITAIVGILVGQPDTAVLVAILVGLNVVLGTKQEVAAHASVQALDTQQVPVARVRRGGAIEELEATALVPGDLLLIEAGDIVPADCRITEAAALEVTESALTGESAPVPKDAHDVLAEDTALGDRTNLLFQSTSVTRGTATALVVETGTNTEVGKIAGMLSRVERTASPLQLEIKRLTVRLAVLAVAAVAFIIVIGFGRGLDTQAVMGLAIATALASIPVGLPTFLNAMLAFGAKRLAEAKAIVRNLTDVEALGSVSAINSDKTGTLTLDRMTATKLFDEGQWFSVDGTGYEKRGAILHAAGKPVPDFTPLAYGLTLCSDVTISDVGKVVGDPTEAALVVLAAKMGVDAEISRREFPRVATVPFDSAYKFMATYHIAPLAVGDPDSLIGLVKGAPDVVMDRCANVWWDEKIVPIADVRERLDQANRELAEQGLRVMSFAYRQWPTSAQDEVKADPMAGIGELTFVALVGIIDPLRPAAKEAVRIAHKAGIEVRMITGDHAVTAQAIGEDLELGPGVITGPEFQKLSDESLAERLPQLHVFGRVAPEDKLRLVSVMQERGGIVAMTGDAVNDAAALKKADVGVAMGSGAEVSKQAAKMVLTDDNFSTLVHAIELGRDIYGKITAQIRYVMAGLFGVLLLMVLASLFGINDGNVLSPILLLFVTFFIGIFPAIGISTDSSEQGIMDLPPRDPNETILNRRTLPRWFGFGLVQALVGLAPFVYPGELPVEVKQTLTFAIVAVSTILMAVSLRRDVTPGWNGPYFPFFKWMGIPAFVTWLAIEWPLFQDLLGTTDLSGQQWASVLALSLVPSLVIETEKAVRASRRRLST